MSIFSCKKNKQGNHDLIFFMLSNVSVGIKIIKLHWGYFVCGWVCVCVDEQTMSDEMDIKKPLDAWNTTKLRVMSWHKSTKFQNTNQPETTRMSSSHCNSCHHIQSWYVTYTQNKYIFIYFFIFLLPLMREWFEGWMVNIYFHFLFAWYHYRKLTTWRERGSDKDPYHVENFH